jgi:hypothetical protein
VREDTHLPADEPVLFLEVTVPDASEMALQRSAPYTRPSMANKLHTYEGCVNASYICTNTTPQERQMHSR